MILVDHCKIVPAATTQPLVIWVGGNSHDTKTHSRHVETKTRLNKRLGRQLPVQKVSIKTSKVCDDRFNSWKLKRQPVASSVSSATS